jgi:hypothetical protein
MRKLMMCVYVCLIAMSFSFKTASADDAAMVNDDAAVVNNSDSKIENYISGVYQQIDFSKGGKLSYEAFSKAYRGYLNLCNAGKVNTDKNIISICDFSLPSTANRLWIIDLNAKKVLFNTYVAHGQGSGDDYATAFSNRMNSHQSSLGFFVTSDTYVGEHGTSLHLLGMDQGFNDAAYNRDIVVHGAPYVCDSYIRGNERLGRSWGCPAVSPTLSLPIINTIKDGTCLFIYYPEAKYLQSSYWLNKTVGNLPDNMLMDLTGSETPKARTRTVQYITNGKIDSVKTVPVL